MDLAQIADCPWLCINLACRRELLMLSYRWQIWSMPLHTWLHAGEISKFSFLTPVFTRPSDVCIGLRLQQVMKSQWQSKSLERSKPLKKLSLKHKLSSSKEKHKFTNSLMAVSKYKWGF